MLIRLKGIDIARGLALLGIIANHIFFIAHPVIATALQDYHAILFMLLAGIVYTYAQGTEPALKNRVRGIVCIILGLALGSGNPAVDVILLNYGWTFLFASFFVHKMNLKQLAILSGAWLFLSPFVSYWVRSLVGTSGGPNVGFQHIFTEPWMILADPVISSSYPLIQWFSVFLIGATIGRLPLERIVSHKATMKGILFYSLLGFVAVKFFSIFSIVLSQSKSYGQAFREAFSLGTGNVDTVDMYSLLSSGPYSGTTPALLASVLIGVAVIAGCSLFALQKNVWFVERIGMATLTLYSLHVFVHTIFGRWGNDHSFLYYFATVVASVVVVMGWDHLVNKSSMQASPGPIEAIVQKMIAIEKEKREERELLTS